MKKRLFIIGAGGLGRGLESCLDRIPEDQRDWQIIGFIDESATALDGFKSDYQIIGDIDSYEFATDDWALIAIGDSKTREEVYRRLKGRVHFYTFIDPTAMISKFTQIEEGCLILAGTFINNNVRVGKLSLILENSTVGHDTELGEFCSLMSNVNIGGGCRIGENTFIGTNATVIPRRIITADVTIGSGSVVVRHIKNSCTVFGNPAKKI
ncbi:acetyltransferase [Carboxylicivirga marina]|uniref:acetyltransferase n=1 Tax=Carboxylicivirga marina TaxID=2800988 RepID=UPI0025949B43|nr:acetyltransferase [uncultured Carboxylicivirga sp.]